MAQPTCTLRLRSKAPAPANGEDWILSAMHPISDLQQEDLQLLVLQRVAGGLQGPTLNSRLYSVPWAHWENGRWSRHRLWHMKIDHRRLIPTPASHAGCAVWCAAHTPSEITSYHLCVDRRPACQACQCASLPVRVHKWPLSDGSCECALSRCSPITAPTNVVEHRPGSRMATAQLGF
jgi:hypothetical protein